MFRFVRQNGMDVPELLRAPYRYGIERCDGLHSVQGPFILIEIDKDPIISQVRVHRGINGMRLSPDSSMINYHNCPATCFTLILWPSGNWATHTAIQWGQKAQGHQFVCALDEGERIDTTGVTTLVAMALEKSWNGHEAMDIILGEEVQTSLMQMFGVNNNPYSPSLN